MFGEYAAQIRENFIVAGYFDKYLVAINEKNEFFVKEMVNRVYDIGSVCDVDTTLFIPASFLPEDKYKEFCDEFQVGAETEAI